MRFGMSELDVELTVFWVEVTETDLQTDEKEILPIPKAPTVLVYHGAPFICNLRQTHGTGFQLDQVP